MDLANQADVVKQLGRALTSPEVTRLPGLLAKASAIVEGYLRVVYADPDGIPSAVKIVVASMVARVFGTEGAVPPGVTSEMVMAGSRQWQRSFSGDVNTIEPWLTKGDKLALQGVGSSAVSVRLGSDRT